MPYDLKCDTCDFACTLDEENDAYVSAKEHESAHPSHFVLIYATDQSEPNEQ